MRVLILGGDGYLGWATAMSLSRQGFEVAVVDNYFRRRACTELNREPLFPVPNMHQRAARWQAVSGCRIDVHVGDVCDYPFLLSVFSSFAPEAVVHYAEQPAAPYSMRGHREAVFTITNNLISTANLVHAVKEHNLHCHIIKLGTMGVYGTPNIDIEVATSKSTIRGGNIPFFTPKPPAPSTT